MVDSPTFRSYSAETFGPVPGATGGSASVLGVKLDNMPFDTGRLTFVSYLSAEMTSFEYPSMTGELLRLIARNYSDGDDGITLEYTNYLASIEGILFKPIYTSGTLQQTLQQFYDGASLHQIVGFKESSDTLQSLPYVPSFPTSNMMDFFRNVAQALGKPIVDALSQMVIFDDYMKLNNPKILEWSVNGARPSPQQESVSINWYDTKMFVGDGQGGGTRCLMYKSDQVISIEAGETQEITVQMQGTPAFLETTIQPVASIPFTNGEYNLSKGSCFCVTGADGYIVSPARWKASGGKMYARRGNGQFDLIITIEAPNDETLSPYTITEGADRPALYVTSMGGVTYEVNTVTVPLTPVSESVPGLNGITLISPEVDAFDMPFVDTQDRAYSAALRYSSAVSSVLLTCSGSFALEKATDGSEGVPAFDVVGGKSVVLLPACKFYRDGVMWRITTIDVDYDSGVVSFTGESGTTMQDFNDNFSDLYYNDEDGIATLETLFTGMDFSTFDTLCGKRGITTFADFDAMPIFLRPEGLS